MINLNLTYIIGITHVGHERNIILVRISLEVGEVINNSCMDEWPWPCNRKKYISGGLLLAKEMHVKVSYEQEQQSLIRIYVPHFSKSFNLPCPRPALVNLDVDILINFWHSQIGNDTNKYHVNVYIVYTPSCLSLRLQWCCFCIAKK